MATVNKGASARVLAGRYGERNLAGHHFCAKPTQRDRQCIFDHWSQRTTQMNTNATPTFGIFVQATVMSLDPAANRVFVGFKDNGGATRV